jgi:hypothetical protein
MFNATTGAVSVGGFGFVGTVAVTATLQADSSPRESTVVPQYLRDWPEVTAASVVVNPLISTVLIFV